MSARATELSGDELVDRGRAAARRRWPEAEITELAPLHGGVSSLTFSATLAAAGGERRVVFKVAPPGLAPVRNRDVLRQARVLRALDGVPGVRVPKVHFEDDGSPPFFVMEFVSGEAFEPRWDVSPAPPSPDLVRARARAAATMLARLQALTPDRATLGGEPVLSPAEELERWAALFATAGDELRGDELSLHDALARRIPEALPARILHGDYRLGNMQFSGDHLTAIIDWELWSLGDPRHDLAWLMAFADPVQDPAGARDAANQAAYEAMPAGEDLLAEYLRTAGGQPPPELPWFVALCYYKLGATMSVLAKRNRRRDDPDPGLERIAQTTPPMLERGLELVAD